jgi:hypothetical protein
MEITKLFLVCMWCLVAAVMAWGQETNNQPQPGILGYLDPQTGAFRPAHPAAQEFQLSALPTFTGTIDLTITITVKSSGLTSISCTGHISVDDAAGTGSKHNEYKTVAATGSGTTRTCTVKVPYAWGLSGQPYDFMYTGYSVFATAGSATALPQRTVSVDLFDSRNVPANGAITNLTAAVTI